MRKANEHASCTKPTLHKANTTQQKRKVSGSLASDSLARRRRRDTALQQRSSPSHPVPLQLRRMMMSTTRTPRARQSMRNPKRGLAHVMPWILDLGKTPGSYMYPTKGFLRWHAPIPTTRFPRPDSRCSFVLADAAAGTGLRWTGLPSGAVRD